MRFKWQSSAEQVDIFGIDEGASKFAFSSGGDDKLYNLGEGVDGAIEKREC